MHWSDKFVGIPYIEGRYDCADMCAQVEKVIFDKDLVLPQHKPDTDGEASEMIDKGIEELAVKTDRPKDGDLVLMRSSGKLNHLGVFFRIFATEYVIHNHRTIGAVIVNRISDLRRRRIQVEGYYRLA